MTTDQESAKHIELVVDQFGKVWVNLDGICVVRVGHVTHIEIENAIGRQDLYKEIDIPEGWDKR